MFVAMALFALFLFSCNDDSAVGSIEDSTNQAEPTKSVVDSTLGFTVKVQDSTLYFSEAGDLLKALTILKNMPAQERRTWEKSVGFVSAQSLIEDLQEKTKSIEKEEDFKQLIAENSELVKASADEAYGMKSRIYGFYPYITSKRGFFVSESYWARAFDKKLYSCHFFDHESYEAMSKLATNSDVSCVNVKSMTLDFNEDEDDNLKSYHHSEVSSTQIELKLHNYAVNEPTKSAIFTMNLVNSYSISSLSETETMSQCYYIVYYDGACCDPSDYSYYYAPYGGTQYFESYGNGWRIKVPYANYFDTHPWSNPNWDSESYYTESYNVYWYNYLGRVDLQCLMTAKNRVLWDWSSYSGSVIYFQDVYAEVKVGTDVYYHSSSQQCTVGPLGDNYLDFDERSSVDATGTVYTGLLTEYRDKPLAVFSGCVSGTVSARFCPDIYYFSFNF